MKRLNELVYSFYQDLDLEKIRDEYYKEIDKYVKIMDIPNIPEQSENLLLNSDKTPSGNDTADSDDWSGLDEP